MSHQFKPGDLAVIIGSRRFPENIGCVVDLVQYVSALGKYTDREQNIFSEGDSWLVTGDSISGAYIEVCTGKIIRTPGRALVDPAHLMPLRDDFISQQQKAKEAEEC